MSAVAQEQNATRSSYERARQVLDAGIEAMGGLGSLRAANQIAIAYRGPLHSNAQKASPSSPALVVPMSEERTIIDLTRRRYLNETRLRYPGGQVLHFRRVVDGREGFSIDVPQTRTGNEVLRLSAAGLTNTRISATLEVPHLLLLGALDRVGTLRWVGDTTVHRRAEQIISFVAENQSVISLYFDARTRVLTRYDQITSDALLGDHITASAFPDYRIISGVKIPIRRIDLQGEEMTRDVEYAEVSVNKLPEESLFRVPPGYVEPVAATGPESEPIRKIGDGVYLLQQLPGGYKVVFVEFRDYVMVLETPFSPATSEAAIALIKQTVPNKPIGYVSFTHFHHDHVRGLRPYIAEGATVVTTPGNKAFVEKVAAVHPTVSSDALWLRPHQLILETFSGKRVFTDGTRTVELYSIGPTSHVNEMVMFYFPNEKILFQGDMFSMTESGGVPAGIESNVELARKIEELGLDVRMLIGVHGRIATMEILREALGKMKASQGQSSGVREPEQERRDT